MPSTRSPRPRRIGVVLAVSAVIALALSACTSGKTNGQPSTVSTAANGSPTTVPATSSASSSASFVHVPVHVSINISDGSSVGVGMPVIAMFNKKITDGKAFEAATKVTVNGAPVDARWYFEYSDPASGHVMEAHLREQNYWAPNSQIHVDLPVKGLSGGIVANHAGEQYAFDDSLTSDFATTDAHIVTVSDATHMLTVTDNGKVWATAPVSLGASDTPTKRGIKVIMEKGRDISMRGPGYFDPHVKWTQRLTYDGEYLHYAPWNTYNITHGIDSSNGCTNLLLADATKLYGFLGVGDVVNYPDASGPRMQIGQGYGDWNITWPLWETGGTIPTQ
jgi:lipoprotein-anchoring transpeptidase ErfK/SrfK